MSTSIRDNPVPSPISLLVNTPAEQTLLGALLINNRAFDRVVGIVDESDFSNAMHARIFSAIGKLIDRGENANPVTLKDLFDRDEALKDVGGSKYLAQLAGAGALIVNVSDYAGAIADLSKRRALIDACQQGIEASAIIDLDKPATMVLEEHEQRLFELAERRDRGNGWVSIGEAAQRAVEETEAAYKRGGQLAGVPTGLVDLDRLLGGLLPGDLEILASRPGMGKTALAAQIACYAAENGVPAAVFELEQTGAQLAQREMAWRSGLATGRQRMGNLDDVEWASLMRARQALEPIPVYIDDTPSLSVSEIRQRARRMKRRHGVGLVVVDHLQLVRVAGKVENRRLEVGHITRTLKQLAKELDLPVLLLSQLTRAVDVRDPPRPILSDLRESGDIEQDADRVLFIYREEYYADRNQPQRRGDETEDKFLERSERWENIKQKSVGLADIIIAKDRHGSTTSIKLHWDASRMRFDGLVRG